MGGGAEAVAGTESATADITAATPTADLLAEPGMAPQISAAAAPAPIAAPVAQPGLLERAGQFITGGAGEMSPERAKILAGIGEGAMQGVAGLGEAKIAADEAKELARWKEKQIALNRSANMPGTFEARTANIKAPDWWSANLQRKGLLQ